MLLRVSPSFLACPCVSWAAVQYHLHSPNLPGLSPSDAPVSTSGVVSVIRQSMARLNRNGESMQGCFTPDLMLMLSVRWLYV